jgi:hypothetical protein
VRDGNLDKVTRKKNAVLKMGQKGWNAFPAIVG